MRHAGYAALDGGVGQLDAAKLIDPRVLGDVPDDPGPAGSAAIQRSQTKNATSNCDT